MSSNNNQIILQPTVTGHCLSTDIYLVFIVGFYII